MKTFRTIGFEPITWLRIQEICSEMLCEPEQLLAHLIDVYFVEFESFTKEKKEEKKDDSSQI